MRTTGLAQAAMLCALAFSELQASQMHGRKNPTISLDERKHLLLVGGNNTCAFDALLQVLFGFGLPLPPRALRLYDSYLRLKDQSSAGTCRLPAGFITKYRADNPGHLSETLLADPEEILVTLWDEIPRAEQEATLAPFRWRWRVRLGDNLNHSVESSLQRNVHVNTSGDVAQQLALANPQVEDNSGRDAPTTDARPCISLDELLFHESEHNSEAVELEEKYVSKSWVYTAIPQWQIYNLIRRGPCQVRFAVSLVLDTPFGSELIAAVCFGLMKQSNLGHYYAVIREPARLHGRMTGTGSHVWVIYDGLKPEPCIISEAHAIDVLSRQARLLFYRQPHDTGSVTRPKLPPDVMDAEFRLDAADSDWQPEATISPGLRPITASSGPLARKGDQQTASNDKAYANLKQLSNEMSTILNQVLDKSAQRAEEDRLSPSTSRQGKARRPPINERHRQADHEDARDFTYDWPGADNYQPIVEPDAAVEDGDAGLQLAIEESLHLLDRQ